MGLHYTTLFKKPSAEKSSPQMLRYQSCRPLNVSKSKFVAPKLAKIKRGAHVFHFPKLVKSIGLGKFFILFFICYLPKAPGLRFFFIFFIFRCYFPKAPGLRNF